MFNTFQSLSIFLLQGLQTFPQSKFFVFLEPHSNKTIMHIYSEFTDLYQLSKTLRFELKPIGKTKETFKQWLEESNSADADNNLFVKDKKIKNAYLVIKPIMDKLHERFIEKALLDGAKNIDFSEYFSAYQNYNVPNN